MESRSRTAVVGGDGGLLVRRIRVRDRILARLRSACLDAELAAGLTPESQWLRTVRATQLAGPRERVKIATGWQDVLDRADGTLRTGPNVIPVLRTRVAAAREPITELIDALRSPTPAPARGVALANALLTDGRGPLYSTRSVEDLGAAVAAALRFLLPSLDTAELDS